MDIPDDYRCPITYQIMEDPVVALDGHSYERKAIEEWFNRCTRSPMTNQVLVATTVMPNHTLKKLISTFVETYAILQREKHDANAEMRRLKLKVDQYEEEIRDRHRKHADGKLVPLRDTISLTRSPTVNEFDEASDDFTSFGFFYFVAKPGNEHAIGVPYDVSSSIFSRYAGEPKPALVHLRRSRESRIVRMLYTAPSFRVRMEGEHMSADQGCLSVFHMNGTCALRISFEQVGLQLGKNFWSSRVRVTVSFPESSGGYGEALWSRVTLVCCVGYRGVLGAFIRYGLLPWALRQLV